MAIRAHFAGVVVHLGAMAGQAKLARVGLRSGGSFGVAVGAVGLMDIGIVSIGRRSGMTHRALGRRRVMGIVAFRTICFCALSAFRVTGIARQAGVTRMREGQVPGLGRIPHR